MITKSGAVWENPIKKEERREVDVVACKCGNTWLEQVSIQQYPKLHNVILGQQVGPSSQVGFYILRCVKCNEIYEPNVQIGPRDAARKEYDKFLDAMEAPINKAPAGEKI